MKESQMIQNKEWVTFHSGGHHDLLKASRKAIYDSLGTAIGALGLVHNTKRQKSQEVERDRLARCVASSNTEFYLFDSLTYRYMYANQSALNKLGYSQHELHGMTPLDILPTCDLDSFTNLVAPLTDHTDSCVHFETVQERKNGERYDVVVYLRLYEPINSSPYFVAEILDISEHSRFTKELQQLNTDLQIRINDETRKTRHRDLLLQQQSKQAAMGEMISNIAHQWRQPLNALSMQLFNITDALQQQYVDREYVDDQYQKANRLIQQMSSTIDDFRNLYSSHKNTTRINLSDVVSQCMELLQLVYQREGIRLELHEDASHAVIVSGTMGEIYQAVLCLVSNAKEQILMNHIQQGRVFVDIRQEGGWGVIDVQDNAGGIPVDVLPRIFEPYFTTKPHGSGLGLHITQIAIEESMHGKIIARNIHGGASFTLYLPLAVTIEPGAS